jgi:hypothetical protein
MIHRSSNTALLWEYVVFLDERIARARKQGKDTALLRRNRAEALRQITALSRPQPITPNPKTNIT